LPVEVPDDALPGELYEHECGATLELYETGNGLSLRVFEGLEEDWGE
jgi:alpha-aminoadipate carrier protein LysW